MVKFQKEKMKWIIQSARNLEKWSRKVKIHNFFFLKFPTINTFSSRPRSVLVLLLTIMDPNQSPKNLPEISCSSISRNFQPWAICLATTVIMSHTKIKYPNYHQSADACSLDLVPVILLFWVDSPWSIFRHIHIRRCDCCCENLLAGGKDQVLSRGWDKIAPFSLARMLQYPKSIGRALCVDVSVLIHLGRQG